MKVLVACLRASGAERPRAGPQIVLGDDIGGSAELARKLDQVAAAHLQAPPLVDAAGKGKDV